MPIIEELVFAFSHKIDSAALDRERAKAKNNAQQTEAAYKKAALEVEKAQKQLAKAVGDASKDAAKAALDAAKASRDAAKEALEDMGRDVDKLSQKLSTKLGKAVKSIGTGLGGGALAVGGTAAAILGGVLHEGLEDAKLYDQIASKLGQTTTQVQRLGFASESLGYEQGGAFEAAKKLREGLGELAAVGGGPAKEALGAIGLKLEDLQGLDIEDQFGVIGEALIDIQDPGERTSAVLKLLGETGLELLPVLLRGKNGFRELGDAAIASGTVLDEDLIASLRTTDKTLKVVKNELAAVGVEILQVAAPAVEDIAKDFKAWVGENDELIKQDLPVLLTAIASGMAAIASAAADVVRWVDNAGDSLADFLTDSSPQGAALDLLDARNGGRTGRRGGAEFAGGAESEASFLAFRESQSAPVNRALTQQAGATIAAQRLAQTGRDRERRARAEEKEKQRALRAGAGAGGGGGGKTAEQKDAEKRLAQAYVDLKTAGIDEDLRGLGVRNDASKLAIDSSVKAAAESLAKGNSRNVAKKAGIGALSGFVGQDLSKKQTDPLLNAIFGNDELPAVPLSDLERGQEPQVLISNIYNTYNTNVEIEVPGSGDPRAVGESVEAVFREKWASAVEQVSKFSKVVKDR